MPEFSERLAGAICELRSMKNDLLFLGKVLGCNGEEVTVSEYQNGPVPPVIYNTEFKILVRPGGGRPPLAMAGSICGSNRQIWKLDRLRMLQAEERRTAFRQRVDCTATAQELDAGLFLPEHGLTLSGPPRHAPQRCRLVDVSLGGLQFKAEYRFERGTWLLMQDLVLLPGTPPFTLPCQICWADRADGQNFTFGCRYGQIPERQQDRLCKVILDLQRKDILAHKRQE